MVKKIFIGLLLFWASNSLSASDYDTCNQDSLLERHIPYFETLSPTYLNDVVSDDGWDANWFLGVGGGFNSFLGSPTGCGDFGKRMKPLFNAYLGKWFSPFVACRLAFEGFEFNDALNRNSTFQHLHVDFMYNVSTNFRKDYDGLPKWDFIPYLGLGCWHNNASGQKPFAISAGVMGRYRIADRLHLTGEMGWSTSWADFDGWGQSNKLGDHLFKASVGLSLTLGKNGWRKVIDAKPYIYQNDALIHSLKELEETNARLNKLLSQNQSSLDEMRKILEIEGLLEKYVLAQSTRLENENGKRNNYSGLNSLRERMRHKEKGGIENTSMLPILTEKYRRDSLELIADDYFAAIRNSNEGIGSPIYFFFKKGTSDLTDSSQLINLDAIAKVASKYHLYAKVVGAADSQTGSEQINDSLSNQRADYITDLLVSKGLPKEQTFSKHLGGINEFNPKEANRHTCVLLYFLKQN